MQSLDKPTSAATHPDAKPGQTTWYISLFLLLGALGLTLALFLYSYIQIDTIAELQGDITKTNSEIAKIEKDKSVLIANILKDKNKIRPSLDVRERVKNFYDIAREAGVRFQGFNIVDDMITTTLTATADGLTGTDPVETVIAMMREHEKNIKILSLKPILSITGDPKKRTTGIELSVTK